MLPFFKQKKTPASSSSRANEEASSSSSSSETPSSSPLPEPRLTRTWSSSSDGEGEAAPTTTTTPVSTPGGRPTTAKSTSGMIPDRKVIYVNLIVLDAAAAVDRQMQYELGKHDIPKPLHQLSSQLVKTWATPERVAEVMSADLPTHLMKKMELHGVKAVAETTFCYGPFLVVQVQIQSVSPTDMVEASSKDFYDEFGELDEEAHISQSLALRIKGCLQSILNLLGMSTKKSLEDNYLPHLLHSQMTRILQEGVTAKLKQRGFHAVSKVLAEDKEARFFFDTLHRVRQAHRPFANFEESFTSISEDSKAAASTKRPTQPMEGIFPLTAFDKKTL
jgi:hypothetical protein